MEIFTKTFLLFLVLLNPFTMSIYLLEVIKAFDFFRFSHLILWASFMSFIAFVSFALAGEVLFEQIFQVRFASFQIFGGITFLIIGIRLILGMGPPLEALRADSSQISGAIAMPLIVGPGTISASVLAGSRLDPLFATLCIGLALSVAILAILLFKFIHDHVLSHNEVYLQRYLGIAGRVTALFTGSFAIELIFKGIGGWWPAFNVIQ
ncbi:MAG: MarC family protein [Nitrospirales bacterium]